MGCLRADSIYFDLPKQYPGEDIDFYVLFFVSSASVVVVQAVVLSLISAYVKIIVAEIRASAAAMTPWLRGIHGLHLR